MLTVGLTGGIGAGKSTVARRLAERGAVLIDADRLAREVVEPGTDGLAEVVAVFGEAVLGADGALDRPALGRRVFGDEAARQRLNGILHPRIAALTAQRMAAAGAEAIVVHDVPLLVENRMGAAYHLVLVVHAGVAERVRRLVADRGMPEADARSRIAVQADDDARRAAADVWLDNCGTPAALVAAVDRLWDARLRPYADNLRRHQPARHPLPVAPPDAATLARVRARLARAVGGRAVPVGDPEPSAHGVELALQVPDPAAAEALRAPLDDAGFVRVPDAGPSREGASRGVAESGVAGPPAAGPGERLHAGADPEVAVLVRVRVAGSAAG